MGAGSNCPPPLNFSLLENYLLSGKFLAKSIHQKDNFTLKFGKPGWTEQSKLYLRAYWSAISLCRQMYCMSKFQSIFQRMQYKNSMWKSLIAYYLMLILLLEIGSCLLGNCNFLSPWTLSTRDAPVIIVNVLLLLLLLLLLFMLNKALVFLLNWNRKQQCCCPRGKSLSSRILEDQFSSFCPCPLPRKFKSWKIFEDWVGYLCQHFVLG